MSKDFEEKEAKILNSRTILLGLAFMAVIVAVVASIATRGG